MLDGVPEHKPTPNKPRPDLREICTLFSRVPPDTLTSSSATNLRSAFLAVKAWSVKIDHHPVLCWFCSLYYSVLLSKTFAHLAERFVPYDIAADQYFGRYGC
jgi:hypothetical protein